MVDAAELLKNVLRPAPVAASPLTTMHVSVGGKPLLAGVHTFPSLKLKVAADKSLNRLGSGYVEIIDLIFGDLHLRVKSAAARKFESAQKQVQAAHLDIDFIAFNRSAARGPLPEMWGLRALSTETKQMLSPHTHR